MMTRGLIRAFLQAEPETQTAILGDVFLMALVLAVFAVLYAFVQARVRRSLR
jgi:hypothetical protein